MIAIDLVLEEIIYELHFKNIMQFRFGSHDARAHVTCRDLSQIKLRFSDAIRFPVVPIKHVDDEATLFVHLRDLHIR